MKYLSPIDYQQMTARLTVRDSENTRYMTYWRFEWTPVFWSKFNRHNGHQYFFYKVQNCTLDGRVVFNDQSVVCLWPKQDYIVFIVLLKFPVMIWSLYHKLLCGNLFLFPIVFFSFLSQKKYTLSIQEFLTLFLLYHHSHTTRLTKNWFWLQDWFSKL